MGKLTNIITEINKLLDLSKAKKINNVIDKEVLKSTNN
jgi:hypothetical protein